jgi:SEC-C motif-containing protein
MQCYCCSGQLFEHCCHPYISGAVLPDNCEALMRSRYSAYCLADSDYLLATLAPAQRQQESAAEISAFARVVHFCKLEIIEVTNRPDAGQVSFIASFIHEQKLDFIVEVSDFAFADRWYYVSGKLRSKPTVKLGRNDLCPCGSMKKVKQCQQHLPSGQ